MVRSKQQRRRTPNVSTRWDAGGSVGALVSGVPDATIVQLATFAAASISAVGSCIAGLAGYRKMRQETLTPQVAIDLFPKAVRISVRNRSSTSRTVYAVHLRTKVSLLDTSISDVQLPETYGGNTQLPVELASGQRLQWMIPYSYLKLRYIAAPWFWRYKFRILVELGDALYYSSRLTRGVRQEIMAAGPWSQESPDPGR